MPLITNVDFDQDYEDHPAAEGEYDLTIIQAEEKTSKAGNEMVQVMIQIEGEQAPPIFFNLVPPPEGHAHARLMNRNIQRFYALFDLDPKAEAEDFAGATAHCLVVQEEVPEYGLSNKLVLPQTS